jgi:hypothetical protein
MDRKERYGFGTAAYPYWAVERALGAMMGADTPTQAGALRGRLKRLLTLGLPAGGPGTGKRRLYSWEEVCQLGIALLLEDCGVDPVAVVPALQNIWAKVSRNVRAATDDKALTNPMMITLRLSAVSGPWRTGDPLSALPWITIAPRIDERARAKYRKHRFKDESDNVLMLIDRNEPGWVATRNLTAELTKLQAALHS